MNNLEYLNKFLTEVFGAVCFCNCPEDGYVTFADKDKSMQTLLVLFPSFLDLNIPFIKNRIENKCGVECYNKKHKFSSLTPLYGGAIISAFIYKNKTRVFYENISGYPVIQDIVNYFTGNETKTTKIKDSYNIKLLPAQNGFELDSDKTISQCLEDYMAANGMPLVAQENGFYVTPKFNNQIEIDNYIADTHTIVTIFEKELEEIKRLNSIIKSNYSIQFSNLSQQQKQKFVKYYFNANYMKPQITSTDPDYDD